ncbi:MAG: peptidoglycan-N-acetylglucosamine deacetylase [Solirubrobacterales bacterium]|jgi:peptidoglycan/xylan/chitin deacetylase (PgdA/CDA1 family)|nr:peptidoglycan-N-acetylglucosamine deacetylase [Solirubrobacterales bacterium]
MTPSRKILCAAALAASVLLLAPAGASARRQRLEHADLFQAGKELVFTVRTAKPVALAKLVARPDVRRAQARFLCLSLSGSRRQGLRLLCLGGRKPHRRVGFVVLGENGKLLEKGSAPAKVKRPSPDKLVVALEPAEAGLSPGSYEWIVLQSNGCKVVRRCIHSFPVGNTKSIRLRPVRAVGCTGGSAGLVTNGPRNRKVVALTFDDGPSDYTDDFLGVLREKNVRATFFEVGQAMPGHAEAMRQILAQGNEIGDHTMDHVEFPDYAQIAGAAARIRSYTHFQPCLFRPPGGGVNDGIVATAGSLGMRTVNWDVDPRDWSNPGSEAIYANVVGHVQPGSIVVMHDGGGPRGETLAALPRIIDTLRGRGYRFATVTELLGGRILYLPYG